MFQSTSLYTMSLCINQRPAADDGRWILLLVKAQGQLQKFLSSLTAASPQHRDSSPRTLDLASAWGTPSAKARLLKQFCVYSARRQEVLRASRPGSQNSRQPLREDDCLCCLQRFAACMPALLQSIEEQASLDWRKGKGYQTERGSYGYSIHMT